MTPEEELTDAIATLAYQVKMLGNAGASTPMGGMEALGRAILDAASTINGGLVELAEAIDRLQFGQRSSE